MTNQKKKYIFAIIAVSVAVILLLAIGVFLPLVQENSVLARFDPEQGEAIVVLFISEELDSSGTLEVNLNLLSEVTEMESVSLAFTFTEEGTGSYSLSSWDDEEAPGEYNILISNHQFYGEMEFRTFDLAEGGTVFLSWENLHPDMVLYLGGMGDLEYLFGLHESTFVHYWRSLNIVPAVSVVGYNGEDPICSDTRSRLYVECEHSSEITTIMWKRN